MFCERLLCKVNGNIRKMYINCKGKKQPGGGNTNGLLVWKDKDGRSLKEFESGGVE
jgi:hypothetical protein